MAGRRNHYDPSRVALLTTAGADGHTHVARFDDDGDGITSTAGGHWHEVRDCDILPAADGHTHELTDQRQTEEEDERARRPGRAAQGAPRRAERREVA